MKEVQSLGDIRFGTLARAAGIHIVLPQRGNAAPLQAGEPLVQPGVLLDARRKMPHLSDTERPCRSGSVQKDCCAPLSAERTGVARASAIQTSKRSRTKGRWGASRRQTR